MLADLTPDIAYSLSNASIIHNIQVPPPRGSSSNILFLASTKSGLLYPKLQGPLSTVQCSASGL